MDRQLLDLEQRLQGIRPVSPSAALREALSRRLHAERSRLRWHRLLLRTAALLVVGAGGYGLWCRLSAPASAPQVAVAAEPASAPSEPAPELKTREPEETESWRLVRVIPVGEAIAGLDGRPVRPAIMESFDQILWRDPENGECTVWSSGRQRRLVSLPLLVQ